MEVPAGTYTSQIAEGFTRMRGRSGAGCSGHQFKGLGGASVCVAGTCEGSQVMLHRIFAEDFFVGK